MLSAFEIATLNFGAALRDSAFGDDLRRFDPRTDKRTDDPNSLAAHSLNHGPPIHRTAFALAFAERVGLPVDHQAEAALLEWWPKALTAVGAIASLCWGEVPVGLRVEVYDEDDFSPLLTRYIPHTRSGPYATALTDDHFGGSEIRAAAEPFAEAARATAAYNAVRRAAGRLGKKDRRRLARLAKQIGETLDAELGNAGYDEALRRGPELLAPAYDNAPRPLRDFALAARAYNELINNALWAALALAESRHGVVCIAEDPGAMRLKRKGRHDDIAVAVANLAGTALLSPPAPFVLDTGAPIDGVYLSRTQRIQWSVGTFADVSGRRLAALEQALA